MHRKPISEFVGLTNFKTKMRIPKSLKAKYLRTLNAYGFQ